MFDVDLCLTFWTFWTRSWPNGSRLQLRNCLHHVVTLQGGSWHINLCQAEGFRHQRSLIFSLELYSIDNPDFKKEIMTINREVVMEFSTGLTFYKVLIYDRLHFCGGVSEHTTNIVCIYKQKKTITPTG